MVANELKDKGYYVGVINGAECKTIRSFLINIGIAFKFPDYYGENLDAFNECINDLEWLEQNNYALVINNSAMFMADDTMDNKVYLIDLIKQISREWANVPNYEGEDEFRLKADFKAIYLP